jgi:signal peptide peptidase SppA
LRHRHLLAWIRNQPWAIDQDKAAEILAYLEIRIDADDTNGDPGAGRIHPSRERAVRDRDGAVAVVTLHGIMAQRRLPGASTGGGADSEKVGRAIDKAAADTATKAIILHIDSPGGSVAGTAELAGKVGEAAARKPVIAQVDSEAASAAYWVASQATEIVSTPGGLVGSIGVVSLHEDISAMLEQEGVKTTLISAGKYKVEGNPFAPLDDEARAHFQSIVDGIYGDFVAAVAAGRGVTAKTVEASYGQGRVLPAKRALAAGMIDRIATFDQTMARFRAPQQSIQRRARAAAARART